MLVSVFADIFIELTNTIVSDNKIQITILILWRGSCLGQRVKRCSSWSRDVDDVSSSTIDDDEDEKMRSKDKSEDGKGAQIVSFTPTFSLGIGSVSISKTDRCPKKRLMRCCVTSWRKTDNNKRKFKQNCWKRTYKKLRFYEAVRYVIAVGALWLR